jgi:hypothetical protein
MDNFAENVTAFEGTGYLVLIVLIVGVVVYVAYELPQATQATTPTDIGGSITSALTAGIYGCGSWTGWGSDGCA